MMRSATWVPVVLGDSCAGCRRPGVALCRACASRVRRAGAAEVPQGVMRVVAGWAYEGAAQALVIGFKERARRACSVPLAEAAAAAAHRAGLGADTLTWVPGSRREARARGFDHGEVLARAVARRLGLGARPLIVRLRPVLDQVGLSAAARRANLAGAFGRRGAVPERVALVDDVFTTGATAAACAAALRDGGARSVEVVVSCLTP